MSDPTPVDSPVAQKTDKRLKWVLLFCVLIVFLAPVAMHYYSGLSRVKIISKTDPKTGYHMEFTVSSAYQQSTSNFPRIKVDPSTIDYWDFATAPHKKGMAWFEESIMHKKPAINFPGSQNSGTVNIHVYAPGQVGSLSVDSEGYADVAGLEEFGTIISKGKLTVDNCPATWTIADISASGYTPKKPAILRDFCLIVHPQNVGDYFIVTGFGTSDDDRSSIQHEIARIRDSIKVIGPGK